MGVTSCSIDNAVPENNDTEGIKTLDVLTYGDPTNTEVACGATVTWPFANMSVGYVEVSIVEPNLQIKITAGSDHTYVHSRLEIANEVQYFPLAGGGLPPGRMQYSDREDGIYTFPLIDFEGQCQIYISTWAVFTSTGNTGNIESKHFAGNNYFVPGKPSRGSYFEYCFNCEQSEPPRTCDSAYMSSDTTLNSYYKEKPTNLNWGWYYYYNKGLGGGEDERIIYAAAGQNVIGKGYPVGKVTINSTFPESDPTVVIEWDEDYSAYDLHIFVADKLPSKRPAPGRFTNTGDHTLNAQGVQTSSDPDGKFYVIVHAFVCDN